MDIEKLFAIFELLKERITQGESAYSAINSLRKELNISIEDACTVLKLNRDLKRKVLSQDVITYLLFSTRLSEIEFSTVEKNSLAAFLLRPDKGETQKSKVPHFEIQNLKIETHNEALGLSANIFKAQDENYYGEIIIENALSNFTNASPCIYGPFLNEEEATSFFYQFQSIEWININREISRPIPNTAISMRSFFKRQIQ